MASAPAARGEIIKSIEFEGNEKFKDHVLRQRLGFELGDQLDPFLAEGGRLTIAEVYRKIGYAFVEVSLDRDRLAQGHLLYRINEGARIQIDSVEFVGNEAIGSGTLAKVIKTTERKWLLWPFYYTEDAIEEDLDRLREFYYDHGYLDYKIDRQHGVHRPTRAGFSVTFVIEEGPVFRVGGIVLSAATRTSPTTSYGTMMTLSEGQVYLKPEAGAGRREIARACIARTATSMPRSGKGRNSAPWPTSTWLPWSSTSTEGRRYRIGQIDVTGNEETRDKVVTTCPGRI